MLEAAFRDQDALKVGDEMEVPISIRCKHAMEYVHLRDTAAKAGEFISAPATISPTYTPEFTAYSAGEKLRIQ